MKVCFLVGSMAISGGTYVIVQHASYLRDNGYDVTLAVQEPFTAASLSWHNEAPRLRCVPITNAKTEKFDLVIATWWKTALELHEFDAARYAYFVQSIESRFYPEAEVPLRALVDATYRLPVAYVTEATWIKDHLHSHFGQAAALVKNGIRKDVYAPTGPTIEARNPARPRVLVEGHFGVPFKNTALAIRLAREAGASEIWLLTGSPVRWIPGVSRVFSRVPMVKTAEIYRSCDVLLKLSTVEGMFGPPLEMFHCGGTAVVFNVTGHDEYIADNKNSRVVSTGNLDGVVETIRTVLNDRDELARLKAGALRTARAWPSWQDASAKFADWVQDCLQGPVVSRDECAAIVATAWSDYASDEQLRLARNPRSIRRTKLRALAGKLPGTWTQRLKQLEAVGEVFVGKRRVY
ncbi:glycosyl transferase family 1 [Burkholderia ubonensis]|nr:glycosyl transferase family 1 [Burkholderia ubonensis]KVQ20020.1 glycosyl transferase family 1 [Burkholderia ubonensis]KVR62421.1 glycosyl transferase family 1 [Burkholderia ubonensis]KWI92764.1 glycosyl transferase family 1 [Burkholderia ubonensis]KWK14046.1 glycosyl transferase family 1 [Burkholderia ubonensis]